MAPRGAAALLALLAIGASVASAAAAPVITSAYLRPARARPAAVGSLRFDPALGGAPAGAPPAPAPALKLAAPAAAPQPSSLQGVSAQKVTKQPDFELWTLEATPGTPVAGGPFDVKVGIKNVGTAAGVPGTLTFYIGDAPTTIPPCAPAGQESVSVPNKIPPNKILYVTVANLYAPATPGSFKLGVFVDSECTTTEPEEGNNYGYDPLESTASPMPNFDLLSIKSIRPKPRAGKASTVTLLIKNTGSAAGPLGTVTIYPDSAARPAVVTCNPAGGVTSSAVGGIAPGATVNVVVKNVVMPAAPGAYTMAVFADSMCQTAEADSNRLQFTAYQVNP